MDEGKAKNYSDGNDDSGDTVDDDAGDGDGDGGNSSDSDNGSEACGYAGRQTYVVTNQDSLIANDTDDIGKL